MSRNRRAVLIGACIVLTSWLALRALPSAWRSISLLEETLAQRAELVARARAKLASLEQLNDSVRALNAVAEALPRLLLVGQDAETAGVDLMRRTRALVAAHPVQLIEFEARRADTKSGPLRLASIAARIETDFPGLLGVLADVEEDAALAIEALDVRAQDPDLDGEIERLLATVSISGWYRVADDVDATALYEPER